MGEDRLDVDGPLRKKRTSTPDPRDWSPRQRNTGVTCPPKTSVGG